MQADAFLNTCPVTFALCKPNYILLYVAAFCRSRLFYFPRHLA